MTDGAEQLRAYCDATTANAYAHLLEEWTAAFRAEEPFSQGQVPFQISYAGALMKLAATLAIDADMNRLTFIQMAHETYTQADKDALRFT